MNTNDNNILLKKGDDLSKKFGIVDNIWKDPNASPDQKIQACASVANDLLGVSVPNNFDFGFDFATDSNEDAPPPLPPLSPIDSTSVVGKENAPRKRKLDSLVSAQKEALVGSRARFKSFEKAKKPHGNIGNKNALGSKHTAEAIEKNRKRGEEQFASGNYLSIYREERAAVGDILGQKLARIATETLPKICKGTQDTQLVIRWFEKFMQAYYGMGKVSAFGTRAYKQMVTSLIGHLKSADWKLIEKPKVPFNQAGKGDKFVFSHPNFILNDDSKLATIVFQKKAPKGAGKGKNSRWSAQEVTKLNKYAEMYKHPAGTAGNYAGKTDWKRVAEKLPGRNAKACMDKMKDDLKRKSKLGTE